MTARHSVLIVEDKTNFRGLFERIFSDRYEVVAVADAGAAEAILAARRFDLVLTDVRMPGGSGLDLLRWVKERSPQTEVVVMTAFASVPDAVEAIRRGAYDYLTKPFDPDDVALVVARALDARRDKTEAERSKHSEGDEAGDLAQLSYREALERGREKSTREYLAALLRELNGIGKAARQRHARCSGWHRTRKPPSLAATIRAEFGELQIKLKRSSENG